MWKRTALLALSSAFTFTLSLSTSSEAASICGLKKGGALNLRSCPKTSCRVRNAYHNGTQFDAIQGGDKGWLYVRVHRDGKKGWMRTTYLCGWDPG